MKAKIPGFLILFDNISLCSTVRHKRPKKVKVFLQPYAGNKMGRTIFSKSVLPMFLAAEIHVDLAGNSEMLP